MLYAGICPIVTSETLASISGVKCDNVEHFLISCIETYCRHVHVCQSHGIQIKCSTLFCGTVYIAVISRPQHRSRTMDAIVVVTHVYKRFFNFINFTNKRVLLSLSQTPVYAARPRIQGYIARCACLRPSLRWYSLRLQTEG